MSVDLIDEALYQKIQRWIKDPNMVILKPEETLRLFQTVSDQTNDKPITLPLIAISRERDVEILQTNKKPLSFSGKILDTEKESMIILNAIPIVVRYQLDIYTKGYLEGNEYLRNFIFNFVNHPKLVVTVPYNNVNFEHNGNIRLDPTATDTSDIQQRLFPGQFTRWTLKLNVDDCYLFSAPILESPSIEEASLAVASPIGVIEEESDIEIKTT